MKYRLLVDVPYIFLITSVAVGHEMSTERASLVDYSIALTSRMIGLPGTEFESFRRDPIGEVLPPMIEL